MQFSVVVPVYNVEGYLPACLESLQSQNFDDFEIVLVNDGSTDASPVICMEFAKSSNCCVKYISHANSGLFKSRMAGIRLAKGDYVISLDSDDALRDDALSLLRGALETTEADVVCFDMADRADYSVSMSPPPFDKVNELIPREEALLKLCSSSDLNSMCGKAIKRTVLENCLREMPEIAINMAEDLMQTMSILDQEISISYIDVPLYYYRTNPSSITTSYRRSNVTDSEYVYSALIQKAKKWDREFNAKPLFENEARATTLCAYSSLAQVASEQLPRSEARKECSVIARSELLRESAKSVKYAMVGHRFDRVLIGLMLSKSMVSTVYLLSKLKYLLKRIRKAIY